MTIIEKTLRRCDNCNLWFMPVDWLLWRVRGYCCIECDPLKGK